MRLRFDKKLAELNQAMITMGGLVTSTITLTADALINQDVAKAAQAITLETEIDEAERKIERKCTNLLMQYQPVARDLRLVSAALKMITDMERIGDQCADICHIAIQMAGEPYFKDLVIIPQMAETTIDMVTKSLAAFVNRDAVLAREVIAQDDALDKLFLQVKVEVARTLTSAPETAEQCLRFLMVAKYFERIGDHSVNIAERVQYAVTGKM